MATLNPQPISNCTSEENTWRQNIANGNLSSIIHVYAFLWFNSAAYGEQKVRLKTLPTNVKRKEREDTPTNKEISEAGLYCSSNEEEDNRSLVCFACHQEVSWRQLSKETGPGVDNVIELHRKLSPCCPYLRFLRCVDGEMMELEMVAYSDNVHSQLKHLSKECSTLNPIFADLDRLKYDKDVLTTLITRKFFNKETYTLHSLLDEALSALMDEPLLSYKVGIHKIISDAAQNQSIVLLQPQEQKRSFLLETSEQLTCSVKSGQLSVDANDDTNSNCSYKSISQNNPGRRLYEENLSLIAKMVCKVCFLHKANNVILPCRHLALCVECTEVEKKRKMTQCPVCSSKFKNIIRVYSC